MAHRTIAREAEHEELVKGSRFLARVAPAAALEEAEAFVEAVRALHGDATHNCWAWRVGAEMRHSDDGEPGGTAGRPMLEVLLKRGLDGVAMVVTRYYGGTKLGAGGLARAYAGSAARALDLAGEREVPDLEVWRLAVPYAASDALFRLLQEWPGLTRAEPAYEARAVAVEVTLRAEDAPGLRERVADLSRGEARLKRLA